MAMMSSDVFKPLLTKYKFIIKIYDTWFGLEEKPVAFFSEGQGNFSGLFIRNFCQIPFKIVHDTNDS